MAPEQGKTVVKRQPDGTVVVVEYRLIGGQIMKTVRRLDSKTRRDQKEEYLDRVTHDQST